MTGAALLTLVATVLTAEGMAVEIDLGTDAGIRVGDRGAIFFEVGEDGELVAFDVGEGEVLDAGLFTAWLLVDPEAEILPGYSVRLEIPVERLTRRSVPDGPAAQPGTPPPRGRFVVGDRVTSCLALRPLPVLDAPRLDCLPPGRVVSGLGSLGAWMKVRLDDGREGWMMERFLRPSSGARQAAPLAAPGGSMEERLRRDLAASRSELEESQAQRRELERRLSEAERDREVLAQRAATPREEPVAANLGRQLVAARLGLENAEVARRELAARLEAANLERGALRQRVDDLEAEREGLVAELETVGTALSRLRQESSATEVELRTRLEERQAGGADLRRQLELAQRALEASQGVQSRLAQRLQEALEDSEGLRGEAETARTLPQDPAPTGEPRGSTVAELAQVSADRDRWLERAERAEASRRSLEAELKRSRAAAADLQRQLVAEPRDPGVETFVVGRGADPCLRVRTGPSMEAPATGCLPPGTVVTVLDLALGWKQVGAGAGSEGWVAAGYLDSQLARPQLGDASWEQARQTLETELEGTRSTVEELQTRLASAQQEPDLENFFVQQTARPCLRVRAEPSAEAPATGCLSPGTAVKVVALEPGWKKVRAGNGPEVWVAADYLESELDRNLAKTEETLEAIRAAHVEAAARIEALTAERTALEGWTAGLDNERQTLVSGLAAARAQLSPPESAGSSAAPHRDVPDELRQLVSRWAAALSSQDVDGYLSCYSARFQPAAGMNRASWEVRRREQLSAAESIGVELSDLEGDTLGTDRAWLRFVQRHRSDAQTETVTKRLELVREEGDWKILEEKTEE